MSIKTTTEAIRTYVVPVVAMTLVFALVLAYGPAVIQWVWGGTVELFTELSTVVDHFFAIGQHARPASGLACWNEIKAGLPTEHLCGDVAHAPASAVGFSAYPVS